MIFDCAEKAYQYFKALNVKDYRLCELIQRARSPVDAKRLAKGIPGGSEIISFNYDLMREVLLAKTEQCRSFRDALRRTKDCDLLHSTYIGDDNFWTTGLDHRDMAAHYKPYRGLNAHGGMLEYIREKILKPESEYETMVDVVRRDGYVFIRYDGERLPSR